MTTERGRPPGVVELFADVWCPFTHVGLRRLVARRDAGGLGDVRFRVRSWPLELVNGAPLEAGFIAEEVADLQAQVAPDLFKGFDVDRWPATSLPALELAAAAYGVSLDAGEHASLLLRDALFERGADISDVEVLSEVAAAADVPFPPTAARRLVEADWAEGRRREVVGSPHFFVGEDGFFCPALDIHRVEGRLSIRADSAAFESFVDQCRRAG
jgi:predicted DsbA family dithiol-disulfide isomerase